MNDWQGEYPGFLFINVLVGIVLALIVGRAAIWLARKIGLMDVPGSLPHKQHGIPTPLAGGVTLLATLLLGELLLNPGTLRDFWKILLPALIVFIVGLWDDFKRLPVRIKILGQIVAGVLLIVFGTSIQMLKPGFLGLDQPVILWLNWFITLFWVVGITNAMNFVDSMDGLTIGIGSIAISFMVLAIIGAQGDSLIQILTLLLGICGGLYFYNVSPAHLFMGDSGAQTLGFLLAAVGILFTPSGHPQASSWFVPIMILGVPIFDTTLVVFSRLRRGKRVYTAGHDHTYHRLVALGFESNRAVLAMHIGSVLLGCLAFIGLEMAPLYANMLFGFTCIVGLALILFLERRWKE